MLPTLVGGRLQDISLKTFLVQKGVWEPIVVRCPVRGVARRSCEEAPQRLGLVGPLENVSVLEGVDAEGVQLVLPHAHIYGDPPLVEGGHPNSFVPPQVSILYPTDPFDAIGLGVETCSEGEQRCGDSQRDVDREELVFGVAHDRSPGGCQLILD